MRRVIAAVLLVFAAVSVCGCSSGKPGANSDRHIKLPYSIEESAKDRYYFMDRKFALTSDDMKVEKTELETAEEWLEKHILTAADPAFDFTVSGRKFSDTVAEYNSKTEKLSDTDTSVRYRTVFEKSGGVTVTVVSELYREYPIAEYTVYLENNGKENSPVISDFLALNTQMTAGDEVRLVSWKGSEASVSDFAPTSKIIADGEKITLSSLFGKSSFQTMPYFSLSWNDENAEWGRRGVLCSVGWTGEWEAGISVSGRNTSVTA